MENFVAAGEPYEPTDLCSDDEFAVLLDQAATVDEGGDQEAAAGMYALLQVLRPDQPQPFINSFQHRLADDGGEGGRRLLCVDDAVDGESVVLLLRL